MNIKVLLLGAAALSIAASTLHAAPAELPYYSARTQAKLHSLLHASGLDSEARSVSVRAFVAPDGRLTGMKVIRSSGSRDTDHAVETVLRKIVVADPPLGLDDGAVTLNLNPAPVVEATAG